MAEHSLNLGRCAQLATMDPCGLNEESALDLHAQFLLLLADKEISAASAAIPPTNATMIVALLDLLRRDQGNSVELMCDNEEAETVDVQCAVEVFSDWTGWEPRRFYGASVLGALQAAYTASRAG